VRGTINERRWKSLSTGSLTRRTVNLIQGVTMVKPKSSRYGTFRLYATPKFQDRNEARNDFVLVQAKNSTGQEVIRVAQLLILLKMYTTSSGKIKFLLWFVI
jgi:hypothetical protein